MTSGIAGAGDSLSLLRRWPLVCFLGIGKYKLVQEFAWIYFHITHWFKHLLGPIPDPSICSQFYIVQH